MRDHAVPFVAAIIERTNADGTRQVLLQTRNNLRIPEFNGLIEFTAGTLDKLYENVYHTLAREILEETGTTLLRVLDDQQTDTLESSGSRVLGFRPYCCVQQLEKGSPWVGFVFRCEVTGEPKDQVEESRSVHWENVDDFYRIFKERPEQIFPLELPAWHFYFREFPISD